MRNRLIELIINAPKLDSTKFGRATGKTYQTVQNIADHLIQNGVIVPPCKVGDTVYEIQPTRNRVQEYTIFRLVYDGKSWNYHWVLKDGKGFYGNINGFCDYEIGKTVFLSKEEAEKALKERDC